MFRLLLRIASLASFAISNVAAVSSISVKGAKFFANGQQFFIQGVAYQGTPDDPLVDTAQCQLDATLMKTIGANSIRVYHVDPYVNHDGCMKAFSDAGIYVWLDLDTFNTTIAQTAPTWSEAQFFDFTDVMDAFHSYDNLGGVWIGNEVINTAAGSPAAPYVKAAVADMKSYMSVKKYRQIPIGYSAADIAELRPMLQNYLTCGSDINQSIDFFGLNSYEWCGNATYESSGYSNLQEMAKDFPVPIFFSETGCIVPRPRTFGDQAAIFGPDMIGTWSGSIIYEWVQETNDYGLVDYPNGQIYSGAPTPINPDFNNLADQWKSLSPSGVVEADYTPSLSAPACPAATLGWQVNGAVAIPTLGNAVVSAAAASVKPTPSAGPTNSKSKASATTTASITSMGSSTISADAQSDVTTSSYSTSTSKAAGSNVVIPAVGGGIFWYLLGLLL